MKIGAYFWKCIAYDAHGVSVRAWKLDGGVGLDCNLQPNARLAACNSMLLAALRWGILSSLAHYYVPGSTELANHAYTNNMHLGRGLGVRLGGRLGGAKRERARMHGGKTHGPQSRKKVFDFVFISGGEI